MAKHNAVKWTTELEAKVLEAIASGDSNIKAGEKVGISEASIRYHRDEDKGFGEKYARAVIDRGTAFFERGNAILDEIVDAETAQMARVKLDWLKWASSKLAPKNYGDKLTAEVSGPDGGPIPVRRVVADL